MKTRNFAFFSMVTMAIVGLHVQTGFAQVDRIAIVDDLGDASVIMSSVSGGSGMRISVSQRDGVKTVDVVDNGKKFKITESDNEVVVVLTKSYGPKDKDKLAKDYPGLFMHYESFPTEVGDGAVELNVNIKKTYKATNVEELKTKHPDAYKVYDKYANNRGGIIRGGIRGGIRLPAPKIRLDGGRIELKIDEDFDSDQKEEKKESKKKESKKEARFKDA